jgi:hypothetical protein
MPASLTPTRRAPSADGSRTAGPARGSTPPAPADAPCGSARTTPPSTSSPSAHRPQPAGRRRGPSSRRWGQIRDSSGLCGWIPDIDVGERQVIDRVGAHRDVPPFVPGRRADQGSQGRPQAAHRGRLDGPGTTAKPPWVRKPARASSLLAGGADRCSRGVNSDVSGPRSAQSGQSSSSRARPGPTGTRGEPQIRRAQSGQGGARTGEHSHAHAFGAWSRLSIPTPPTRPAWSSLNPFSRAASGGRRSTARSVPQRSV